MTTSERKRIGLLTSGGDCSGLNAVIRAVVLACRRRGWEAVGIRHATDGLLARPPDAATLGPEATTGTVLRSGGTLLGTISKGDPFAYPDGAGGTRDRSAEVAEGYRALGLDALIAIGGDGSLALLDRLAREHGLALVGIPKTIDNDVARTALAVGHMTALWVGTEALDRLEPTAASHSRVMILEVMGRDAGHIALSVGIGGGADIVLIPEIPYRLPVLADKIAAVRAEGRDFALVVVAEGVPDETGARVTREQAGGKATLGGIGRHLAQRLTALTGAETRVTALGHVQRGGTPVAQDRILASAFGVHAVDLVAGQRFSRMVAWTGSRVTDVPIAEVAGVARGVSPDSPWLETARGLGICLGDRP